MNTVDAADVYDREVAYDEVLADRIRALVGGGKDVTEQKMFGGLAFLVGGNMAVAASGQGGILVRVDPEASDELVATTSARVMEMRGREMPGLAAGRSGRRRARSPTSQRGSNAACAYARSLPPKR